MWTADCHSEGTTTAKTVGAPRREVVRKTVLPAGWQAAPANAGRPALSSEQNRTEQFRVYTLFNSQQFTHYTGLKRY